MKEKNTKELNEVLGKTHLSDFEKYCVENKESVSDNSEAFSVYVKNLLQEKKLTQQYVFLQADIPERYGYKLLSGEKRIRLRRRIGSNPDACRWNRIGCDEKCGEKGRKYCFDRSVRSGCTGRI